MYRLPKIGFLVCTAMMGLSLAAYASQPYGPTAEEAKILPDYCQNPEQWKSILGSAATWNNHTCYGINRINRYYKSRTSPEKRGNLEGALRDFNYSVTKLPPDFVLMPEIYMYRGITYGLMDRVGEAVADLQKAIGMDPKLTKAHNELADLYETKLSQRDKALEIITAGLRHNPDVKSMQRRYTRLGGKLPYPEPIRPAQAADTQATTPADAAPSAVTAAPAEPDKSEPAAAPASAEQSKIGSPNNPYCRFCPD